MFSALGNYNRQTQLNLFTNIISLIANVAVGLFFTPFLIRSLGIIAYGIVPLAMIINQYINVIAGSLTGSLTRFYSISIESKQYPDASKYLSSSFAAITTIIIFLSPVLIFIVIRINWLFNIPPQYIHSAKILFFYTILSFILSLYSSLFNITLYALNRLDLLNIIKIIRVIIKVGFTVFFFKSIQQSVEFIGYANILTETLVLILSIYYFRKTTTRNISIALKYFEKNALVSLGIMTLWVLVHQIGDTGLYRIDNILVNNFWSTKESGTLGALTEIGTYVMLVVSVIGSLFGPLILIAYSKGNHEQLIKLALDNSLIVGLITALLVGLLIGFAKPIIRLWLGEEFVRYSSWFILKQVTLPFYAAAGIYAFVYKAWNRVIMPAIATLIIGLVNFAVSFLICKQSAGSENIIIWILISAVVFIVIQSYGLNSYCFYKLYPEISLGRMLLIFVKIFAGMLITTSFGFGYLALFSIQNLFQLFLGLSAVSIIGIFLLYQLLERVQKAEIISMLNNARQRIKI